MKAKITTAVLFTCSALSIVWLVLATPRDNRVAPLVVMACALGFLAASCAVFLRPRISYFAGTISGIVALHWFSRIELFDFPPLNSWILFNLPDGDPTIIIAKLRILFVVTIVISTTCSLIRLLPANWTLRRIPVRQRTWPAFAVCFVVIFSWYCASARPYRIPWIVDAVWPELTVLHVEKSGIQLHETTVTVYRDGKFYVTRNDRRLLQYRFAVHAANGVLPQTMTTRVQLLTQSPQIRNSHTQPATVLRDRKAEGWYIRTRQGVLAFTTEYGTELPKEVVDLFRDLESVAPTEKNLGTLKDVCLGFCYDPLAGLGLLYINDRCKEQNGTRCK
ncbi:MAG: hypothetical protein LAO23_22360 [Acidobacteriia bacterium]|nr:hypothetical protein [Terriglobia bacterium]